MNDWMRVSYFDRFAPGIKFLLPIYVMRNILLNSNLPCSFIKLDYYINYLVISVFETVTQAYTMIRSRISLFHSNCNKLYYLYLLLYFEHLKLITFYIFNAYRSKFRVIYISRRRLSLIYKKYIGVYISLIYKKIKSQISLSNDVRARTTSVLKESSFYFFRRKQVKCTYWRHFIKFFLRNRTILAEENLELRRVSIAQS